MDEQKRDVESLGAAESVNPPSFEPTPASEQQVETPVIPPTEAQPASVANSLPEEPAATPEQPVVQDTDKSTEPPATDEPQQATVDEQPEAPDSPAEPATESLQTQPEDTLTLSTNEAPATEANKTEEPATPQAEEAPAPPAASEEDESEESAPEAQEKDYSALSLAELMPILRDTATETPNKVTKERVVRIVGLVKRLAEQEQERLQAQWVEQGETPESFVPTEIPEEAEAKAIQVAFNQRRREFIERTENEQKENLRRKQEILQKIEALTREEEKPGETYRSFEQLSEEWRSIGHVPPGEVENLYRSYAHHRELFYDYLKINKELRDLDYRKNYDRKVTLCVRCENLLSLASVRDAFKELQGLHEEWKELGPVMQEKREEIWQRFKATSDLINTNYRDYQQARRAEMADNLQKKELLCEEAQKIFDSPRETMAHWVEQTNQIIELQKRYKEIGPIPRARNDVWERFQTTCQGFFDLRRSRERALRSEGRANLQRRIELCVRAEALQDSTEWRATTDELIELQRQWKAIGYTSHKKGQALWERFRAAQNHFFARRDEAQGAARAEQKANVEKKRAIIAEVEAFVMPEDPQQAVEQLRAFQNRWAEIGFVPSRQREELQAKYRTALNKHYESVRGDRRHASMMFDSRMEAIGASQDPKRELEQERRQLDQRIRGLEASRNQLENNVGFFAKANSESPMVRQVKERIAKLNEDIDLLKEQLKKVRSQIKALERGEQPQQPANEGTSDN